MSKTQVASVIVFATLLAFGPNFADAGTPNPDRATPGQSGGAIGGDTSAPFGGGPVLFGDPIPGLTEDQLAQFFVGKELFEVVHTPESGLGPVFNKEGCATCHNAGDPDNIETGIGGAGSERVTRFGRFIGKGIFDPMEDWGGSLRQHSAISEECMEFVPEEATIEIFRTTTPMFGAGLIEAIPDETLLALADPDDSDGDGISGRVHIVFDPFLQEERVGRFGWKAQVANLDTFTADASMQESGITNILFPEDNDPNGIFPPELSDCDFIEDPEDIPDAEGISAFNRMATFQRLLAPPPRTPLLNGEGFALFRQIGCDDCHTPVIFTGDSEFDVLAHKPAFLFSDLLLHDMGALGDEIVQGDAQGFEMRTPPLWGVWVRPILLHDGRADSPEVDDRLRQAIEGRPDLNPPLPGHAGEAAASRDAWMGLSQEDQEKIIEFLKSI